MISPQSTWLAANKVHFNFIRSNRTFILIQKILKILNEAHSTIIRNSHTSSLKTQRKAWKSCIYSVFGILQEDPSYFTPSYWPIVETSASKSIKDTQLNLWSRKCYGKVTSNAPALATMQERNTFFEEEVLLHFNGNIKSKLICTVRKYILSYSWNYRVSLYWHSNASATRTDRPSPSHQGIPTLVCFWQHHTATQSSQARMWNTLWKGTSCWMDLSSQMKIW